MCLVFDWDEMGTNNRLPVAPPPHLCPLWRDPVFKHHQPMASTCPPHVYAQSTARITHMLLATPSYQLDHHRSSVTRRSVTRHSVTLSSLGAPTGPPPSCSYTKSVALEQEHTRIQSPKFTPKKDRDRIQTARGRNSDTIQTASSAGKPQENSHF